MAFIRYLHLCCAIVPFLAVSMVTCDDQNNQTSYARCRDDIGDVFNCSGTGLISIPDAIHVPMFTTLLDLSNNQIQNVSFVNYTALGDTLEKLLLHDNHIMYLDRDAFRYFTELEYLDLSGNSIMGPNLEEHMFNDLRSLSTLIMERNPIGVINEDTFNFMELPRVRYLDLSHCLLVDIRADGISLPELDHLDLSWNKLEVFHADSFRMMTELKVLDLSHNRFKVFDHIPYLPEIRTINLDSNSISIVNISDAVWKYADSLERLYLRSNDIMRFTRGSFPWDLETLVEVRLENNDIHCDCRMTWFKDENYDFTNRNISIPCQYPYHLKGVNLLDVVAGDLTCSVPIWEILLLSGLGAVGMVVFGLSLYLILKKKCKRKTRRRPSNSSDRSGDYTAVYVNDDDDGRVSLSDQNSLIQNGREFDV